MTVKFKGLVVNYDEKSKTIKRIAFDPSVEFDSNALINLNDEPHLKEASKFVGSTRSLSSLVVRRLILPDALKTMPSFFPINVREVVWPTACSEIPADAFRGNTIERVLNIEHVEKFRDRAFKDCLSLKEFNVPPKVKEIPDSCFQDSGLETITGLDHIKKIGVYAFTRCKLKEFRWPDSCCSVPDGCFHLCVKLSKIFNLDKVETVGENAFYGTNVDSLVFTDKLSSVSKGAFAYMTQCSKIELGNNVNHLGSAVFSKSGIAGDFVWPTKCPVIPPYCFEGCKLLKSISNLSQVKNIKESAFCDVGLKCLDLSSCGACLEPGSLRNIPDSCLILPPYYLSDEDFKSAIEDLPF